MTAKLPADLEPVDGLLDRWGSYDRRDGHQIHPLEALRLMKDGAILGGAGFDPDWILFIDQIVTYAPQTVNALLCVWYRNPIPITLKAKRLGLSRSVIYTHWHGSLRFVQGALGHKLREIA